MATIANLLVHVGVSDDIDKGMSAATSSLEKGADKMVAAGTTMTKNITLPLLAVGGGLFALASRQEEAEAKMVSSFKSMGAASWTTVDALKAQASEFQKLTTFGDEAIIDFQAVMLTFGNVTGDVFTDATRLGLDMSAKLGQSLQSSAIQLGKALNDPVQGISALSRVGVSFTKDQKDMVKAMVEAGDVAGAQALILSELEKQFGGTAEAMALTGSGQAKQAMNALGDAGESIGALLIPAVTKLAGWLKTVAEWFQTLSPQTKEWIVRIATLAAAIGPVLLIGGKLISGLIGISGALGIVGKAFLALTKLMMANPYVLLIAATIALVTLIVMNWDKIKAAAAVVVDWIRDRFNSVISFFQGIPGRISSATSGMWDGIRNAFRSAMNWIIDKWNGLKFTIPSITLPWGGKIGGLTIGVPAIPRFHAGGVIPGPRGAEVPILARAGERVSPLSRSDEPTIIVLELDGREFYRAMVKQSQLDGMRNVSPNLA